MTVFDARFAAYLVVAALLIVTPGPDMALVTRNAFSAGRRAAPFTAFGVGIGILGWACASALGVGGLLERSVVAFTVLKIAGALYLGYLGVRSLLGGRGRAVVATPASPRQLSEGAALKQGILGNLLNPKAGVIFVSVLPQFVRPGDSSLRLALMLIAFEVMIVAWLCCYGALISRAGRSRFGSRLPHGLERATGVVLIFRLAAGRRTALSGRSLVSRRDQALAAPFARPARLGGKHGTVIAARRRGPGTAPACFGVAPRRPRARHGPPSPPTGDRLAAVRR